MRIVEFPGADCCACCGTHVVRAGQVGLIKVLSCQKFRDGVRIEMAAGGRALRWVNAVAGQKHAFSDTKNQVIRDFNLSEADLAELLPSGRQSVFTNRIGWCRTYLKKAGLIESPSRAHFIITDAGKRILDTVDEITNDTLRQFPSFVEFVDGEAGDGQVSPNSL